MNVLLSREVTPRNGKVWASGSKPVVKVAFEVLMLTAIRSGEAWVGSRTEIDLDYG